MKKSFVYLFAFLFVLKSLVFISCTEKGFAEGEGTGCAVDKKVSLKILNWNAETFFDANYDGCEYSQFSGSGWTYQKYEKRLENLVEVIKATDADVVVLQELEKKEQLNDLYNRLCSSFNSSKNYNYGCFAKEEGSAIGLAVLSRMPLKNPTVHSLDIRTESKKQPSMRPLLKVYVEKDGKQLLLMVNHWKSKSGGEAETKVWRDFQESVLAYNFVLAFNSGDKALACGDFNKDISEFTKFSDGVNPFNLVLCGIKSAPVYSGWYKADDSLVMPGTYFFKDRWERIDHFFAGSGVGISDFKVENEGNWATAEGKPKRYLIKYSSGYSDHFPISCRVEW